MPKILVLGDVMLDKYSYGEVKRLNPEGPNPLLNIDGEEVRLGGSANVAANIASIEGNCDLIGIVGEDDNSKVFNKKCGKMKIAFNSIISTLPTITKWRFIETTYNQQLLRIDYEEIFKITTKEIEQILEIIKDNVYEIIVISDYNKGIVTPSLINKIKEYTTKNNIKVLVDSKPYNYKLFKDFYLVKPNFKEFCEMIKKDIENTDEDIEKHGIKFVNEMNTNLVITRGKKGASLITVDGDYYHIETEAQKVFDVTGAGDTFIATLAYAINSGKTLKEAIELGNKASGVVIEKVGTSVITKEELFNNIG